jgi:hypothetical protein
MLKIDLAKAFIMLKIIAQALQYQGFQSHFVDCVHSCITSPTFSVVINGKSFGRFNASRGLRQGCPLLPCLFVLAINELSVRLQQALDDKNLSGVTFGPGCPPIHCLLFAKDLIIYGKADICEEARIKSILQDFCDQSGQTPNWS